MPVGALILGLVVGAVTGAIAYLCLGMGTLPSLVIALALMGVFSGSVESQ